MNDVGLESDSGRAARDRALFDAIALQYTSKDLYGPCRHARKRRLLRTIEAVGAGPDVSILEVGCGAGFTAQYMSGRYGSFIGMDYSRELIDCARMHNGVPNVSFLADDFYTHAFAGRFDVILMVGVLHHMTDIPRAVGRARELLKPGGCFIANEPHASNPVISLMREVRKRLDPHYSVEQRELSKRELREAFARGGFSDVRVIPQGYLTPPIAEVRIRPALIGYPLSILACLTDDVLERWMNWLLGPLSWDLVVIGRT